MSSPQLHRLAWPAAAGARRRVVVVHGLGEHAALHEPLARRLAADGAHAAGFDLPGHGHSPGTRVLVESVDALVDHVLTLLDDGDGELPLVLVGHSLGALVVALTTGRLVQQGRPPAGIVLSAAALPEHRDGRWIAAGGLRAELEAAGIDPMALRKDPSELCRNPAYVEQIRADPLVWTGGIRPETLDALERGQRDLAALLETHALDAVPALFVHGERDDLAPIGPVRAAAHALPHAELLEVEGALHNVLADLHQDEIFATITAFVSAASPDDRNHA